MKAGPLFPNTTLPVECFDLSKQKLLQINKFDEHMLYSTCATEELSSFTSCLPEKGGVLRFCSWKCNCLEGDPLRDQKFYITQNSSL